jgi:hypothetical protein
MKELIFKKKELEESIAEIEIKVKDYSVIGCNSPKENQWLEAERLLRIRGKLYKALTEINDVLRLIDENADK